MSNLEFIRGLLMKVDTHRIDLSEYVCEGELEVWLDENGEVNRTYTASILEDVNLEDPFPYNDADDDIEIIMDAIRDEMAKCLNWKKYYKK